MTIKRAKSKAAGPLVAWKGFDKNLSCRGYQFEVGKTYSHKGTVSACASGFHACENPLDVWAYYGLENGNRFCRVHLTGATDRHEWDSKIAAETIFVESEVTLGEMIKAGVEYTIAATKGQGDDPSGYSARIGSSGDYAQIGSSGYSARIGSSGDYARIGSSGDYARIGSSGDYARIGSSGDYARIGSSGDYAQIGSSGYSARIGSSGNSARIGSSGDYARIGSSGDYAQIGSSGYSARIGSSGNSARIGSSGYYARIGSSGYSARIGSSGDYARIEATGENAVVASAGYNATVKAANGTWISLAEFDRDGKCIGFAIGCIGQDGLKEGVSYIAKGGKLVMA
jgi:hypothetical protein